MSERKLLTKYIPKDFDPAAMPRAAIKRGGDERIRLMLPMTCQCSKCRIILFPGKKFHGTKRTTTDKYADKIAIFTLHFRCSGCSSEIVFKTDPKNRGYELVSGASRMADQYSLALDEKKKENESNEGKGEFKSNVDLIEERAYASHLHISELDALEQMYDEAHHVRAANVQSQIITPSAPHLSSELSKEQLEKLDEDEFLNLQQSENDQLAVKSENTNLKENFWDELLASDTDEDDESAYVDDDCSQQSPAKSNSSTEIKQNFIPLSQTSINIPNIFAEMDKSTNQFTLIKKRAFLPSQSQDNTTNDMTQNSTKKLCAVVGQSSDQLVQLNAPVFTVNVVTSNNPLNIELDDYSDSD